MFSNTATKRSGLPALSPSSASSSFSTQAPSSLSSFKSSLSTIASTSIPSSPSPSSTPLPFTSTSSSTLSVSLTAHTSLRPTSPFSRPTALLKPLNAFAVSSLLPMSTSPVPPSSTTKATSPQSSLLKRATTPRPAFLPSLPTAFSLPSPSPPKLATFNSSHINSLLTPLSSNSSSPSTSSPSSPTSFSTPSPSPPTTTFTAPSPSTTFSTPSSPSPFSITTSSVSPSSPRPFSVPENPNIPSLLARGKGEDRPVFGVLSTTTPSPSPTKPSISPHLQSIAFALKTQKPSKNDLRDLVLRPILSRPNKDNSNEILPSTLLPLAEVSTSSVVRATTLVPTTAQTESTSPATLLPASAVPLSLHFLLDRELQPPLHPFQASVNRPNQFLRPPDILQSTFSRLPFPTGRVPDKNALSTNKKQESLTFLSPSSLSSRRGSRLLPNTTIFRLPSRPNRDFFIPTANFPMPPIEEGELHRGLMIQRVLTAAQVLHNGVEDPDEDHSHMPHMTMLFPVMMGAQRFSSLQLNPECPHCHPAFLKPNQCHPCVLIK